MSMLSLVLWLIQLILALLFAGVGLMKLFQPYPRLVRSLRWPEDFSPVVVRLIGAAEFLGAVGLIAPIAAGTLPVLTPIAAGCLALLMALAVGTHVRRKERQRVTLPAILMVLALVVCLGRFGLFG